MGSPRLCSSESNGNISIQIWAWMWTWTRTWWLPRKKISSITKIYTLTNNKNIKFKTPMEKEKNSHAMSAEFGDIWQNIVKRAKQQRTTRRNSCNFWTLAILNARRKMLKQHLQNPLKWRFLGRHRGDSTLLMISRSLQMNTSLIPVLLILFLLPNLTSNLSRYLYMAQSRPSMEQLVSFNREAPPQW